MTLSRQFKAVARISGLFAATWAAVGELIGIAKGPSLMGDGRVAGGLSFAFMYGCGGASAGAITSLVIARAEQGREAGSVPQWRMIVWGVVGGVAPAALLGTVGLVFGAPMSAVRPLLGVAVLGGCLGGL